MQTLTQVDRVDIEDYDHMTKMNENMNWIKPTHLLTFFLYTSWPHFIHLPLL